MAWQDRVRRGAYAGPSGDIIEFDFEDVSRETTKRTAAFQFQGVNESYVQDNGYGGRRYPLRCIFWGDECDRIATAFELLLLEPGVGTLTHPLYGTFDVVPFGTITRRDALKSAGNQAIVEVTFWTTTGVVYPTAGPSLLNEVELSVANFNAQLAQSYGESLQNETATERANLRGTVDAGVRTANEYLRKPAEALEKGAQEFNAWQITISRGISALVGNPVLLAGQVTQMIQGPARALIGIENQIVAYADFIRSIINSDTGQPWRQVCACSNPRRQVTMANDWYTADLFALNGLVSMAIAAISAEYKARPEALSVADYLLDELEALVAWREQGFSTLGGPGYGARINVLDTGAAYQAAQETIAYCAGYLVTLAFTLAAERAIVLDRPRTIIDLAAELYGEVDEKLDFLIDTNNLTGSEILELPRGREIVWYPDA